MEITLNNWPLSYVEDDVALPILTPNSMMFPTTNILPDVDLRRGAKYLRQCKDAMWERWSNEYL